MDRRKRLMLFFLIPAAFALSMEVQAAKLPPIFGQTMADVQTILLAVGSALAAAMIAWEGVKWITADNPAEREDAKKGVIYVMIGLVLLKSSNRIIEFLLATL